MNSYINLGEPKSPRLRNKIRKYSSNNQRWVRFDYTDQFSVNLISWRLENTHPERLIHIIEYFKKYFIGRVEKQFADTNPDKIILVLSGPFKSLSAAKAAYMIEESL